jgi:integrase
MLLVRGYASISELTEEDLKAIPPQSTGTDVLDAALCSLGVFNRTPQRGPTRRHRGSRHTIAHLIAMADIPESFRAITELYLEVYSTRVSDIYNTLRQKVNALSHFWRFIALRYPAITSSAEVLPLHGRAYIPYAVERAREIGRGGKPDDSKAHVTAHAWLLNVRVFFADICTWATEPDSPFASSAPRAVPLARRDLRSVDYEKARQQHLKRMTATIFDLEREVPKIRAFAVRRWQEATVTLKAAPHDAQCRSAEPNAFWDWAILELLVQSGIRIEEASELTTLDILKRRTPDGRVYYMLHVKPSKYDRARVIPIGDGLGRVLAEMIRHVRSFHGTDAVPFCDHWDYHEKRPSPRAPYLVQALKHPSALGVQGMRRRLRMLSANAGAVKADGTPLRLHPHDCRRVFASEHLNNNTPVHVIQALLGHATINTVLVYAKLYPQTMVEEYRKAVRGLYIAFHGEESLRNPTPEEWAAFSASCSMRDMGTHLCALPTGEHCPKGLVCLGCVHAQPKKSAAPIFRRMLASHERELAAAKGRQEPAGQVAARELEVARIRGALIRAEELSGDVAAAIEASCLAPG